LGRGPPPRQGVNHDREGVVGMHGPSPMLELCYSSKCWPRERLKPVEEFPPGLFLVVFAEMLALLPFPVSLRDCALVTLGPCTHAPRPRKGNADWVQSGTTRPPGGENRRLSAWHANPRAESVQIRLVRVGEAEKRRDQRPGGVANPRGWVRGKGLGVWVAGLGKGPTGCLVGKNRAMGVPIRERSWLLVATVYVPESCVRMLRV
jgi:hypothetical protein